MGWDGISSPWTRAGKLFKLLRLIRLSKLLRLTNLSHIMEKIDRAYTISRYGLTMLSLLIGTFSLLPTLCSHSPHIIFSHECCLPFVSQLYNIALLWYRAMLGRNSLAESTTLVSPGIRPTAWTFNWPRIPMQLDGWRGWLTLCSSAKQFLPSIARYQSRAMLYNWLTKGKHHSFNALWHSCTLSYSLEV